MFSSLVVNSNWYEDIIYGDLYESEQNHANQLESQSHN